MASSAANVGHRTPFGADLLCESCGYALEGTPKAAACPECGRPVAESLPDRREGTPWQQKPGIRAWAETAWGTLRHPARTYRGARVDPEMHWRDVALLWDNIALASFLGLIALFVPFSGVRIESVWLFGAAVVLTPVLMLPLLMLTELEQIGIRYFGRRRGWRIDRTVSAVVCAHASIGWTLAMVLGAVGFHLGWPAYHWLRGLVLKSWSGGASPMGPRSVTLMAVVEWIPAALPVLGFGAGLLVFETLVWIGMRQCRFANRPTTCARSPTPAQDAHNAA